MRGEGHKCDNCGEFAFLMQEQPLPVDLVTMLTSVSDRHRNLPENWYSLAFERTINNELDTLYRHFCSTNCLSFYSTNVLGDEK